MANKLVFLSYSKTGPDLPAGVQPLSALVPDQAVRGAKGKTTTNYGCAVQVFDLEVPIPPARVFSENDVDSLVADFSRIYRELNGEASGHPEGGIEITGFVVRARGVTDPPDLTNVPPALSAVRKSRRVYWSELEEYIDTPVLQLDSGRIDDSLRGPTLLELPDTVMVLRPGQTARFDALGSLVIDL